MSKQSLSKRLRREIAASPKKAATLGLLLLVAMYFWAPLLLGGGKSAKKSRQPAAPMAGFVPTATQAAKSKGTEPTAKQESQVPWRLVARWIDDDPGMKPATELLNARDPFQRVVPRVAEDSAPKPTEIAQPAKAITPESLGLSVTSTLIGPKRRTALINGRTFDEGQTIAVSKDGDQFDFILVKVSPRSVVLAREGKQYELTIPQPALSGRLELYGSTN